jgi:hypothetical protein
MAAALHPNTKKFMQRPAINEKSLLLVGLVIYLRTRQQTRAVVDASI